MASNQRATDAMRQGTNIMRAFAINGQTAATKGFSGILYRATALIAGFDAGTFLTESAAAIGGFQFACRSCGKLNCSYPCGDADFDSRWTGAGSNVVHPNFHVSRMVPVARIVRETARVMRWAALDGEAVTMAHRAHVAKLAKGRHAEARAFCKAFPDVGPALLAVADDGDAVRHAVAMLGTPDGSASRKVWADAMRQAKMLHFLTI